MTSRGDHTRNNLLDAAERLMGDRGVVGVSMQEIRIASGAKNKAALQFHFGGLTGLIDAMVARHLPRIAEIQQGIFDERSAAGRLGETRTLVEILVRPAAEYLSVGPHERQWVKIMADLGTQPDMRLVDMVAFAPPSAIEAGNALMIQLKATLPEMIAAERIIVAAQSAVHICADRARLVDDSTRSAQAIPHAIFVENVIDMAYGALVTPLGAPLAALLGPGTRAPGRRTRKPAQPK